MQALKAQKKDDEAADHGTASDRKAVNDAIAYIRSLAELRGRNVEWAEDAVRSAASLSAGEALERGVIDLMADNLADLLEKLDGRELMAGGVKRTLSKSAYIHDITDIKAQYILLRNFWQAVKQVFPEEWANPKEYLILRNLGVVSLSTLAGTVIDRCLARQRIAQAYGELNRQYRAQQAAGRQRAEGLAHEANRLAGEANAAARSLRDRRDEYRSCEDRLVRAGARREELFGSWPNGRSDRDTYVQQNVPPVDRVAARGW